MPLCDEPGFPNLPTCDRHDLNADLRLREEDSVGQRGPTTWLPSDSNTVESLGSTTEP